MSPVVSILITTYNRPELIRRAVESVRAQSFTDFELIIIDDASALTQNLPLDARIRYYRNQENKASIHGDRVHIRRFVNEIAKGKYFVYLCDDDYWLMDTLLARQVALFEYYPSASMIIGGQTSDFGDSQQFHSGIYPCQHMTSEYFLRHFAKNPITCNINTGATLFHRDKFIRSGAFQLDRGSKWQAGYEMLLPAGSMGDVVYMDEPCLMVEVRKENASFQRTQLEHYLDSVESCRIALPDRIDILRETIYNIGQAYLKNAEYIKTHGALTMCSPENISQPVTEQDIITI